MSNEELELYRQSCYEIARNNELKRGGKNGSIRII